MWLAISRAHVSVHVKMTPMAVMRASQLREVVSWGVWWEMSYSWSDKRAEWIGRSEILCKRLQMTPVCCVCTAALLICLLCGSDCALFSNFRGQSICVWRVPGSFLFRPDVQKGRSTYRTFAVEQMEISIRICPGFEWPERLQLPSQWQHLPEAFCIPEICHI